MQPSKDYQPTEAHDHDTGYTGVFDSPFLAAARAEDDTLNGRSNGNWTFTPTNDN